MRIMIDVLFSTDSSDIYSYHSSTLYHNKTMLLTLKSQRLINKEKP